jgi:hypothetical protein
MKGLDLFYRKPLRRNSGCAGSVRQDGSEWCLRFARRLHLREVKLEGRHEDDFVVFVS